MSGYGDSAQAESGSGLQASLLARHYVLDAEIWTQLPVCGAPRYYLPDFSLKEHRLKKKLRPGARPGDP